MENEFVSYEMALALKKLRFDEPCFTYYKNDQLSNILELVKNSEMENVNNEVDNYISAPTFSQAFRWFLKKHKLYAVIIPTITMDWTYLTMTVVENMIEVPPYKNIKAYDYSIKEEAEQACLLKLIELVKNETK